MIVLLKDKLIILQIFVNQNNLCDTFTNLYVV